MYLFFFDYFSFLFMGGFPLANFVTIFLLLLKYYNKMNIMYKTPF